VARSLEARDESRSLCPFAIVAVFVVFVMSPWSGRLVSYSVPEVLAMAEPDPLRVACSLGPEAIRARRADLLPGLFGRAVATEHLPNGVRLRFEASSEVLHAITSTIDAERQCCRFLRFELTLDPDAGPISLTLTGPAGTAEFLSALSQK
jgi:hypothetical protein